ADSSTHLPRLVPLQGTSLTLLAATAMQFLNLAGYTTMRTLLPAAATTIRFRVTASSTAARRARSGVPPMLSDTTWQAFLRAWWIALASWLLNTNQTDFAARIGTRLASGATPVTFPGGLVPPSPCAGGATTSPPLISTLP